MLSDVGDDEWAVSPSGVVAYLFARSRCGRVVAVDRQGRVEVLVEEEREYSWPRIAPDGRRIAYSTTRTEGGQLHWQLADGNGLSELLHAEPFAQWPTSFSPNGRWLAYSSTESGESEIYLRPYPDLGSRRFVVSKQGGVDLHWSSDSRELFYRNGDAIYVVDVTPSSEPVVGTARELFRGHFQPNGDQSFDVFPDNRRFLMIQPVPESRRELRVMTGVGLPRAPTGP